MNTNMTGLRFFLKRTLCILVLGMKVVLALGRVNDILSPY